MLLGAALLAAWLHGRRPPPPPDPLAIEPAQVVSAHLEGVDLARGSPAFAAAAGLPTRLSATRPAGGPVAWAEPVTLRLVLRDRTVLWLQIMREGVDDLVRVNADTPSNAPIKSRAAAIRALRLRAYRLPADSLSAILAEVTGADGESQRNKKPTNLSTRTKRES